MDLARKFFVWLAWLFVLAVAIQFLLAGLGVLGGESIEAHRQWGFVVLHLIPILMLIAAIVGRMGRNVLALTVVLFLLVFVQPLFADPQLDPRWLRSLHVLNALLIFALGYHLAQRGTRTVRDMAVAA
jgi:heme A synthase